MPPGYAESILRAALAPFLVLRADLRVNTASEAFYHTFQVTPDVTEGRFVYEIGDGQWNNPELRKLLEEIIPRANSFSGFEVTHEFSAIGKRTMTLNACCVENAAGVPEHILLAIEDITARHEAEAALRDAKQRLEQTLAATEIATWTWDVRTDRVLADRNLARLFSVSPEDAEGGPIARYIHAIHPGDRARVEALIAAAMQSESGQYQTDYRLMQADGSIRWVTARGRAERDAAGQTLRFPGVVIDITERKQAEEKSRESEERFRSLFAAMDQGFCVVEMIFDGDGRPVDWIYQEVNPAFEKHTGLTRPAGRRAREVVPNLEEHWFEIFGRIATNGEPVRFQESSEALGRWFEVYAFRVDPAQQRVAVLFSDITESKRAQDALRASEERYRTLFNSIDQGFCIIEMIFDERERPVDYRFLTLNAAFEKQTGLVRAQGKRMRELAPEHEGHWFEIYGRIALTGEPARFEQHAAALGRWFDVCAFSADEAQRHVGILFSDITERRTSEQALRAALVEVERSSRAKDDFLAALSHELRTPLTPVLMTATALESDPALPAEMRDQLAMMRRNIELEARLIDDLLDITRISRGKLTIAPVPVDIHQLLNHTAEIVRSDELGKQVRIVFVLDAARH
jgi:PAS domain S-box-containing protein